MTIAPTRGAMNETSMNPLPDDVLRTAARWYSRLTDDAVSQLERAQFESWRSARPEHDAAYRRLLQVLEASDAMLADASASTDLFATAEASRAARMRAPIAKALRTAAYGFAATLAIVCLGIAYRIYPRADFTSAVTRTGEQREVRLADGSVISLNTDTELEYSIDSRQRRVKFSEGEAFFQIAPDRTRPFVILIGSREIKVVGTAFNVRRLSDRTDIAVTEGRVSLSREIGALAALFPPSESQSLTAGMSASYATNTDVIVRSSSPPLLVGAWRSGQLIYRGTALSEVVADLDRYFAGTYSITDDVAHLKVSAVIRLTNEAEVLNALTSQLPVRATRTTDRTTVFSGRTPR